MSKTPPQKTIIVYGPQGSGKGLIAHAVMKHYGCSQLIDEWWPHQPLTPGALHLTNVSVTKIPAHLLPIARAVSTPFESASPAKST
jgi:hypothetical protein